MVYKTKKNNRLKKIKNVQRRYTKKQNYYGGQATELPEHNSPVINDINDNLSKVGSVTSNLASGANNLKTGANDVKTKLANGLNKASASFYNGISGIAGNLVKKFGTTALNQAGEAGTIVMTAAKKPLEEAAKTFEKIGEDAATTAGTGAVNVVTDVAAAVPGLGALVEGAKLATDLATTGNKFVQILEKGVNTFGDVVDKTSQNVEKTLDKIHPPNLTLPAVPDISGAINNKIGEGVGKLGKGVSDATSAASNKIGEGVNNVANAIPTPQILKGGFKKLEKEKVQIGGRISDSIAAFTDPIGYQSILKGGNNNKTKSSATDKNKKTRSRRVRFSFE
jgi:hypothetical protein